MQVNVVAYGLSAKFEKCHCVSRINKLYTSKMSIK